jgi:hypothetical protein
MSSFSPSIVGQRVKHQTEPFRLIAYKLSLFRLQGFPSPQSATNASKEEQTENK